MNGTCNGTLFLVHGLWGGAKRSNIIKFQLLSQFQIFLNQTLCVFSHPGVMLGGSKLEFSEHGHVAYQIKGDDQQTRIQ